VFHSSTLRSDDYHFNLTLDAFVYIQAEELEKLHHGQCIKL